MTDLMSVQVQRATRNQDVQALTALTLEFCPPLPNKASENFSLAWPAMLKGIEQQLQQW